MKFRLRGKFTDRKKLERFQERAFKKLVKNVLTRSPYYAPLLKEIKQPVDFPVITKSKFMEEFDRINTVGLTLDEAMNTALRAEESRDFSPEINSVSVGLSTGTSGRRGIFVVSAEERAAWTAMIMSRVIRPRLKHQKIAFFLRANNNLYTSVQSSLLQFNYFDIFRPIGELAAELQKYQPDILAGQPSVLIDLCDLVLNGKLKINVTQVISFAEVLEQADRKKIESVFCTKLTEVYQCTEGFLGVSCEYGVMHLNEDIVYIEKEWIDGQRFHPIITDLTRSSQPVVRYRLDDILIEKKEKCRCGSAFIALEKIEGRADDILIFKNENGIVRIYPDLICRRIALLTNEFNAYQIIQSEPKKLEIWFDAADDKKEAIKNLMMAAINGLLNENRVDNVLLQFQSAPQHTRGNKFTKIARRINPHAAPSK